MSKMVSKEDDRLDTKSERVDDFSSDYFMEIKITPNNERVTSDFMTLFEFTEVVGIRTTRISQGAPIYIPPGHLTPKQIAIQELFKKKSPLEIRRQVGDRVEIWKCNDLIIPVEYRSSF